MLKVGLLLLPFLMSALGCHPEPVVVELEFPSTETFLYSERAQILAFQLGDDLGVCPTLVEEVLAGSTTMSPAIDSGERSVCSFCSGGWSLDAVEEGPWAFVAVASDAANTPLLAGCSVAEVYEDAPPIEIHLYMTSEYQSVAEGPPPQDTVEEKCGGDCL